MKKILLVYTFSKMSLESCGTETVALVKFFLSNIFFSIFFFFHLKKLNHSLLASEFSRIFFNLIWSLFIFCNGKLFILSTDFSIVSYGFDFIDSLFSIALSLKILFFNSRHFCLAANVFPPLTTVENMSTLYFLFKSNIFSCLNSWSV